MIELRRRLLGKILAIVLSATLPGSSFAAAQFTGGSPVGPQGGGGGVPGGAFTPGDFNAEVYRQLDLLSGDPATSVLSLRQVWELYEAGTPLQKEASSLILASLFTKEPTASLDATLRANGIPSPTAARLSGTSRRWNESASPAVREVMETYRAQAAAKVESTIPLEKDGAISPLLASYASRFVGLHAAPLVFGDGSRVSLAAPAPVVNAYGIVPVSQKVAELRRLQAAEPAKAVESAAKVIDGDERRIEIRLSALRTLDAIGSPAAQAAVIVAADSEKNWQTRREAILQIGRRAALYKPNPTVVATLKRAYAHENDSVRLAAGWALAQLGVDPGPEPKVKKQAPPPQQRTSLGGPSQQNPQPKKSGGFGGLLLMGAAVAAIIWMLSGGPANQSPPQDVNGPAPIVQVDQRVERPALPPNATIEEKQLRSQEETAQELKRIADIQEQMAKQQAQQNEIIKKAAANKGGSSIWLMLLMSFGPIFLMVWLFSRMARGGAGSANAIKNDLSQIGRNVEKPTTKFTDVAGIDDSMVEVQEIVDFLKNPEHYTKLGGEVPKGVLLEGPPGTGKTLMARALAGEVEATFIPISGSDFVEMFVGVGAARVRGLFEYARQNAPAIIFIDEIDAVGGHRDGPGAVKNDEREQTINALLAEMDGFDNSSGVIVLAATNRIDKLDPALTRPGRFDRKVHVGAPDVLGREAILGIHGKSRRLGPDVDLQLISQRTTGLTGAFLKNVLVESANLAGRLRKDAIGQEEVNDAVDRVTIGGKRNLFLSDLVKKRIAVHEAGHVLAGMLMPNGDRPNKVTIVPHGSGALGFAEHSDEEGDKYLYTKDELEDRIVGMVGSLAAERLVFGDGGATSGVSSDLQQATRMAQAMVREFGMDADLGMANTAPSPYGQKTTSETTEQKIDAAVKKLLDRAYERAKKAITDNRAKYDLLVMELLKKETLNREEIEAIILAK